MDGEETNIFKLGDNPDWTFLYIITLLSVGSLFTTATNVPNIVGYLSALLGYSIIIFIYMGRSSNLIIRYPSLAIAVLVLIISIGISSLLNPSRASMLRLFVYPISLLVNLYLVSELIPKSILYRGISRITGLLILIGLPAIIDGSFGPISAWHYSAAPLGSPFEFYPLVSILNNPNRLGAIAAIGMFCALWDWINDQTVISSLFFLMNTFGVYFSQSRTAIVVSMVGGGIFLSYKLFGEYLISIIAFSGVILASIVLAISIDIIPSPGLVQNLDFTGRIHLWKATFYGYLDRPVFGWGAGNHAEAMNPYISREDLLGYGPHNSYARIFLELGFIGGVSYIYIIYRTIMIRVRTISSDLDIVELMILFTVIGIHFFEGYTILGLSLISSVSAIIIGFNKNIM